MCSLKERQGCWGSLQVSRDSFGFMKPALIEGKVCRSICLLLSPIVNEEKRAFFICLYGRPVPAYQQKKKAFNIHSVQIVTCTQLCQEPQDTHKQVCTEGLKCLQDVFLFSAAHWDKTRFIQQLETWWRPVTLNDVLIFANILTPSFLLPSSSRCAAIDFIIWNTTLSKL